MQEEYDSAAWGHASILQFFEKNRLTTKDIYPSEWFFIHQKMSENMTILDIGCAKGGMANVMQEHLQCFHYVGIDINAEMIKAAKKRYPAHQFYHIDKHDYSVLHNTSYDLVLCLGILHLNDAWQEIIKMAWQKTKGSLILDLRESHHASIENKAQSFFKMDYADLNAEVQYTLPYNIINASHALQVVSSICHDALKISYYGYTHALSPLAVSPLQQCMVTTYCIERTIS